MSNKTPTYSELKKLLEKELKFVCDRQKGSHQQYEGYYEEKRRVVTLDVNHDKFPPKIQKENIKSMIKQIGINKKLFYKLLENI